MVQALLVQTTVDEPEMAEQIARELVDRRLAACVQVGGPVESVYRWRGEIETAQEWVCLIKTRRDAYLLVEQAIRELHPYDEPEILATEVVAGSQSYLAWLNQEVQPVH